MSKLLFFNSYYFLFLTLLAVGLLKILWKRSLRFSLILALLSFISSLLLMLYYSNYYMGNHDKILVFSYVLLFHLSFILVLISIIKYIIRKEPENKQA